LSEDKKQKIHDLAHSKSLTTEDVLGTNLNKKMQSKYLNENPKKDEPKQNVQVKGLKPKESD